MLENGEKRKQHDVQLDRQARQRLQITKREQGKISPSLLKNPSKRYKARALEKLR